MMNHSTVPYGSDEPFLLLNCYEYGYRTVLEPSGPEARARVFVHVLYEFRDY